MQTSAKLYLPIVQQERRKEKKKRPGMAHPLKKVDVLHSLIRGFFGASGESQVLGVCFMCGLGSLE